MQGRFINRFNQTILSILLAFATSAGFLSAQDNQPVKETREPVFRVPKIKPDNEKESPEEEQDVIQTAPAAQQPATAVQQPIQRVQAAPFTPAPFTAQNTTPNTTPNATTGPVERVADARPIRLVPEKINTPLVPPIQPEAIATAHPLDRALQIANDGLENMRRNISDYQAVLVKRERVGNQLSEQEYMKIKIRNPRVVDNRQIPFSIYMKFIGPRSMVGREVIWVDGRNDNNLIVHDTNPLVRFRNLHLAPEGMLAMKGNRYPIYEAGLENLVLKLIEKAERDREAGVCEVNYRGGAQINQRPCTLIEVVHHKKCEPYEFHKAKVYIDDEYQIPVRFAAYDWPVGNQKPQLMEEYTYINVKLNVGLSDQDFDVNNKSYNFVRK